MPRRGCLLALLQTVRARRGVVWGGAAAAGDGTKAPQLHKQRTGWEQSLLLAGVVSCGLWRGGGRPRRNGSGRWIDSWRAWASMNEQVKPARAARYLPTADPDQPQARLVREKLLVRFVII